MGSNSEALMIVGFLMMAYFFYQLDNSDQNYKVTSFLGILGFIGMFLLSIGAFFTFNSTLAKVSSLICAIGSLTMICLFITALL